MFSVTWSGALWVVGSTRVSPSLPFQWQLAAIFRSFYFFDKFVSKNLSGCDFRIFLLEVVVNYWIKYATIDSLHIIYHKFSTNRAALGWNCRNHVSWHWNRSIPASFPLRRLNWNNNDRVRLYVRKIVVNIYVTKKKTSSLVYCGSKIVWSRRQASSQARLELADGLHARLTSW